MVISEFRLFTLLTVAKAKSVVENPDEPADPEGGGGFAEWAMLALQAIRLELAKSYRQTIDLLSEMPGIHEELGLSRLPHFTILRDWFENIPTEVATATVVIPATVGVSPPHHAASRVET